VEYGAFKNSLSAARFEAYRLRSDETDGTALARYLWNVALCEALYPSTHMLEVALRNAVHREASKRFGSPNWLDPDSAECVLLDRECEKVRAASRQLKRHQSPRTPDRLVAELSFGFWTSLLSVAYEQRLIVPIIAEAFPELPRRIRTRNTLAGRFNYIRKLRNRVAHHEPIWNRPSLQRDHAQIVEAIGWMSPGLQRILGALDRFPKVYMDGPQRYRERLADLA
jgi:hypothetical protein